MRFCLQNVLKTAVLIAAGVPVVLAETPPTLSTELPHIVSVVRTDPKTGRLVRRIVVSPRLDATIAKPAADPTMLAAIDETAKDLQVSPELVHSVIEVESNYNPYAVSSKGAQGLMQLMPATARRFGVSNSFDARQNIEGGVRYLKFLQEKFQDDRLAIAAYNAGEKAVSKYGGVPPYPETVDYVAKVGQKYSQAKKSAGTGKIESKAPEQASAKAAEDEPRHVIAYLDPEGRLHIATR